MTVRRGIGRQLRVELGRNAPVVIALVIVVLIGAIGTDAFLTSQNFTNVARRVAGVGIIATGMTILMVAGGIDLSVGAAVSLISIFVARSVNGGHPDAVSVLVAVGIGSAIGLAIGAVIVTIKAPPFMVTLGALSMIQGVAIWHSDARPVPLAGGFEALGVDRIGGVPVGFLVLLAVMALAYGFLHHLRAGRLAFAIGSNEVAARLAGVRVVPMKLLLYAINGALVGLGAAVITSRVGSGSIQAGTGLELEVIAAVVIGGATLAGGQGSLMGTLLGVLLLGFITSTLNLLGAGTYLQHIVFGAFIVLAVGLRSSPLRGRARRARRVVETVPDDPPTGAADRPPEPATIGDRG